MQGRGSYGPYEEYSVMSKMGWTEAELYETSYERYLEIQRMISIENKEEKRRQERNKRRNT